MHTRRLSVCKHRPARPSTSRTITVARILCRFALAAANSGRAHSFRTVRASGSVTGNTRVTLAAAGGSRVGEEAVRGDEIVVFLFYRKSAGPSSLN